MSADSLDGQSVDAVIVGGGFYGCTIAVHLARQRRLRRILLIERESALFTRASYNNQARVHNGYHYPRSFTTAYRSRANLPRFVRDWPAAMKKDFTTLYAIARHSKVNAPQFQRFCRDIGASLEPVDVSLRQMFEPHLIEGVFLAQEYVFDATELARWAKQELADCGVEVRLNATAREFRSIRQNLLQVSLAGDVHPDCTITSRYIFNCAYSGLNQIGGDFPGTIMPLKQEIAEMALMQMPPALEQFGITVMDGPFFSVMPFPARGLHALSHVRYTPHLHWQDAPGINPYRKLEQYSKESRADRMVRDVSRYLPVIRDAQYVESLFEVKTVLVKNESDDGRPILFERYDNLPGVYSILGGKIDNIYDAIERLDEVCLA